MTAALIITLRETLEAALVAGIVLAYLDKTGNFSHKKYVWYGVSFGVLLSLCLAWIFQRYLGGFEGRAEEIYEGVTMIIAAGLLTWMILWMMKQRSKIKANIEGKVEAHLVGDHPWGILFLVFVGVLREGIETVIFLQAALQQSDGAGVLTGGLIGIVLAVVLAWVVFKGVMKVSLKKFFTVTGVLLIFFAAGLLAHGIHEFEEAGVLPQYVEHVWDINPMLDEK
ncbi:FTR1 family protein, partial [Candidatus Peregrinibacteria bacterium]|nr:FTR1 family protein [Candidatus Peregrinibacteria bacterium]